MFVNKFNKYITFRTETVTKSHHSRNMGRGNSYCSIFVECRENGYEIFICYKAHAQVDI